MTETYIPLQRVAAVFNLEGNTTPTYIVDAHVFQCIAHVSENESSENETEGVGAALAELTKSPRNAKGDFNTRGLALALWMNGDESEEQVLARLTEIARKVYPENEANKAMRQRMALIGLSANSSEVQEQSLRTAKAQINECHVIALNAHVARYQKRHGCNFQTAYNAVMRPRAHAVKTTQLHTPAPHRLVVLPGVQLHALRAGGEAPNRLKLFNWGTNRTTKGDFIVNDTTADVLPTNQLKLGLDLVALDFEHNTLPGSPEYERTMEPRPVAAFGSVEVLRGDGVYLTGLDWRMADALDRYQDISPVPGTTENGEVVFIHSVALCRNGATYDLTIENAAARTALSAARNHCRGDQMDQVRALTAKVAAMQKEYSVDYETAFRLATMNSD